MKNVGLKPIPSALIYPSAKADGNEHYYVKPPVILLGAEFVNTE
jgi:hypothetical protein